MPAVLFVVTEHVITLRGFLSGDDLSLLKTGFRTCEDVDGTVGCVFVDCVFVDYVGGADGDVRFAIAVDVAEGGDGGSEMKGGLLVMFLVKNKNSQNFLVDNNQTPKNTNQHLS